MNTTLQIFIGLSCLLLSGLGLMALFRPDKMATAQSIVPQGSAGLNTIRGLLGGLFLACVVMLSLGLATQTSLWFVAVAIVMGGIVSGRILGLLFDDFDKSVLPPLAIEVLIGSVLLTAHFG